MTESTTRLNPRSRHHFRRVDETTAYSSMISLFILISTLFTPAVASTTPLICNRDTEHQCVCGTGEIPPHSPPDCEQLIQGLELPVVDMRLRHVNLEAQLHTSENYESYFKRRIAQIVSAYCENQVNECPGVSLKITKNEDARISDEQFVLYATDENEPPLTQENVILLKVEKHPGSVTRIMYVIVKSATVASFTEEDIMDPNKIKIILGSQHSPLSRILGGIRIDSVRVSRIRREVPAVLANNADNDNTRLYYFAGTVGIFFFVCYVIGAIKLYRDHQRKKRRKAQEGLAATTTTPNYGTLKGRKPSRNGSSAIRDIEVPFESEYKSIDESIPSRDPNEPRHLTERQARFMFMCDPSQLPREPTFNSQNELDTDVPPPKEISIHDVIDEEQEHAQVHKSPEEEIEHVPALVIVPSMSINSESSMTSETSPVDMVTQYLRSDSPPPERPQSRRGSRVDEEEIDLTELGVTSKPLFSDLVIPDGIQAEVERPESAGKWSSSEGDVDVYYKMSDDEELKRDDWNAKNPNKHLPNGEESDADNEDERPPEETDAFVYERLREEASPLPPHEKTNS